LQHTVYVTTNISSGKFYIGKHSRKSPADSYVGSGVWVRNCKRANIPLVCDLVAVCQTEKEAYDFERVLVVAAKKQYPSLCMNFLEGGIGFTSEYNSSKPGPMLGKKHSEETKRKIGLISKGRKAKEKHHFWGKKLPDDVRAKMSASHQKIAHLRGRKVMCIELQKEFLSLNDAAMFARNDKSARSNIRKCCNGEISYAYGYTWKFI
jgi:hypothetical protein